MNEKNCKTCGKTMFGPYQDGEFTDQLYGGWVNGVFIYSPLESEVVAEDHRGSPYLICWDNHKEIIEVEEIEVCR